MFTIDDAAYYSQRERAERCLAANATDPAARAAHLALAGNYRKRAAEARLLAESSTEPSLIIKPSPPRRQAPISSSGPYRH
jgi:hypothetical protein